MGRDETKGTWASGRGLLANIRLEHMRAVQCTVRRGSFSRAAEEMGLSQSAVSQLVKSLEAVLGLRLFDRQRGASVRPTSAGLRFARLSEDILKLVEAFRDELDDIKRPGREVLHVAAGSAFIRHRLLPQVEDMRARYAALQVKLHEVGSSDEVLIGVLSGRFDLGVYGAPVPHGLMTAFPIGSLRLVLLAPADHEIFTVPREGRLELLRQTAFAIGGEEAFFTRTLIDHWASKYHVEMQVALESSSVDTVKEAVRRSVALAILPESAAARELEEGKLCVVDAPGLPLTQQFSVIASPQRPLSTVAHAFISELGHKAF
jgi:DNA-binding transcriptional LysR family regulator